MLTAALLHAGISRTRPMPAWISITRHGVGQIHIGCRAFRDRASPEYLSRYGTPKSLEELEGHRFLIYTLANNPYELAFTKGSTTRTVMIDGLLESNLLS